MRYAPQGASRNFLFTFHKKEDIGSNYPIGRLNSHFPSRKLMIVRSLTSGQSGLLRKSPSRVCSFIQVNVDTPAIWATVVRGVLCSFYRLELPSAFQTPEH